LESITNEFQFLYDYREKFGKEDLDLRQFEIPPEHVYKDDFGQKLSFYKKFKEELLLRKKMTEDMMNNMRADLDYINDYLECEKAFIEDAKARQALQIAEEMDKLRKLLEDQRDQVIHPIKRQIKLLERQLNRLGRVQEKLAVFSKIIKRKGLLLRVRHMYDIFSPYDLRLKIKVFDEKNNLVDDFGNICVYKTRRLENHLKRYESLKDFVTKLKSRHLYSINILGIYDNKYYLFEEFENKILDQVQASDAANLTREDIYDICLELGKNFRKNDIVSNKLIRAVNRLFKYIRKIPRYSHSEVVDIQEEFYVLNFVEEVLKDHYKAQKKRHRDSFVDLGDSKDMRYFIQFILYEVLSEPRFKYKHVKGKKYLNSYVMVEDSQIVGFTYLELVWLIRNTTLVKEF
jgi:hypothetical protein